MVKIYLYFLCRAKVRSTQNFITSNLTLACARYGRFSSKAIIPDPLYDKNCPLAHKGSVKMDFTIVCDGPECARGHQLLGRQDQYHPFHHIIFITKFLSNLYHSSYHRGGGGGGERLVRFFLRRAMDILLGVAIYYC